MAEMVWRCDGCGQVIDDEDVDVIGGHCRAEDDGNGNPVPVHCGPVRPEPDEVAAGVEPAHG